jgi:hypothetical protein
MSIYADVNLYPGVNPHLNSFLQSDGGGWESFHTRHINDLAIAIDSALPQAYYAVAEKSLQISAYDLESGNIVGKPIRTTPDVTLYQTAATSRTTPSSSASIPTLTFPVAEAFADEEYLAGIVIYRLDEGKLPGVPVTRIELLSPGNKPLGNHYWHYLSKRQETLKSGLRLVEIDYLHETRPVIQRIPSYRDRQSGAHPYTIIVSDPRPNPEEGPTQVYGFGVDDPLPIIAIPLADADYVTLDFGAVYHQTFASLKLFRLIVDYEQAPEHFERYSEADQALIRQRMATIARRG